MVRIKILATVHLKPHVGFNDRMLTNRSYANRASGSNKSEDENIYSLNSIRFGTFECRTEHTKDEYSAVVSGKGACKNNSKKGNN